MQSLNIESNDLNISAWKLPYSLNPTQICPCQWLLKTVALEVTIRHVGPSCIATHIESSDDEDEYNSRAPVDHSLSLTSPRTVL